MASRSALTVGKPSNFYPNPFLDIGSTYMPSSMKEMFDLCLTYQLTNPIINAVTTKLSSYAVTNVTFPSGVDGDSDSKRFEAMFSEQFYYRKFVIEHNLDYFTFGNGFASVYTPIDKYLVCQVCKKETKASMVRYRWSDFEARGPCPKCKTDTKFTAKDVLVKAASRIRLIRWSPKDIIIRQNQITNESRYYYDPPTSVRNAIRMGDRSYIEHLPNEIIAAVKYGRTVLFAPGALFHSKRPTVSRDLVDNGWGAPLILPVLKDAFLMQVLKKAHEAVSMEHIVPMRVLYPQVTASGNPFETVNLTSWQADIQSHVEKWRRDMNHIPIVPIPIGYQHVGGAGKSLSQYQELRALADIIISGMGVPVTLFYGDGAYSGASVNMRSLENEFGGLRQDNMRLTRFIVKHVASIIGTSGSIPTPQFEPFKMADDLQRSAFLHNLYNARIISGETLLAALAYDFKSERDGLLAEAEGRERIMVRDTESQARAQAAASKIMQAAQPTQPGQPGQPELAPQPDPSQSGQDAPEGNLGPTVPGPEHSDKADTGLRAGGMAQTTDEVVDFLRGSPEESRNKTLSLIKERSPSAYEAIVGKLNNAPIG